MADLVITAANVIFVSGNKLTAIAEQAITAGQSVYAVAGSSGIRLAQADGTVAESECVGIALHGCLTAQPITYAANGAVLLIGATTAKTTTYMVSAAAGGIAPQADLVSTNKITRIGYATDTGGLFTVDIKSTGAVV